MEQISIFETLKPRVILLNDKSWIYKKLVAGAEFELKCELASNENIVINLFSHLIVS